MKSLIVILSLITSFQTQAIQFNFISMILGSKQIKNFGTYRAYGNGAFAKSCNEYKNNPPAGYKYNGQIGDGVYRIKPDSNPAFDVYCDMTNDGGGWTNLSATMGSVSSVMFSTSVRSNSGGGSPNPSLARLGISSTGTPNNLINGSLSSYSHPNGSCSIDYPVLQLSTEIISLLNATQVKIESKSYYSGGGSAACGGMLTSANSGAINTINPANFNTRYLGTCSNTAGERWWEYTSTTDWHYSYPLTTLVNPIVLSLYVNCGTGTSNIQIKSIMIK